MLRVINNFYNIMHINYIKAETRTVVVDLVDDYDMDRGGLVQRLHSRIMWPF